MVVVMERGAVKTWAEEGLGGRETFGEEHWAPCADGEGGGWEWSFDGDDLFEVGQLKMLTKNDDP